MMTSWLGSIGSTHSCVPELRSNTVTVFIEVLASTDTRPVAWACCQTELPAPGTPVLMFPVEVTWLWPDEAPWPGCDRLLSRDRPLLACDKLLERWWGLGGTVLLPSCCTTTVLPPYCCGTAAAAAREVP